MNLAQQIRDAGVVGAGGAGFPAHVKAGSSVDTVIANGAECEPLMHKDAELMARHAPRVVEGLSALMRATGAARGIIGVKSKRVEAIGSLERAVGGGSISIHPLGDFYPTGDEFVLVYETTGRLIPPGGIPLQVGAVVQNVETLYHISRAMEGLPVTRKFLTVAGSVDHPVTSNVPVGTTFREVIALAGGATTPDPAILVGGAMMGRLTRDPDEPVTKTTGGLIVLPGDHPLVTRLERPEAAQHQIGKSACDQCSYCTELCPRFLLGYAIEPHKVMRSLLFSFKDEGFWSEWGMLCCECGLCTLYACPEDLYPREACQRSKRELKGREFAKPSPEGEVKAHPMYEFRRVPIASLLQRLGLTEYDRPAPYRDPGDLPGRVRLPLKQHAGTPAGPVVRVGDRVTEGALLADIPEGQLGARIHASIPGVVRQIEPEIVIEGG